MLNSINSINNIPSFTHKTFTNDLLSKLWDSRPKSGNRNEVILDYFQCLTKKPFSSQTTEIDLSKLTFDRKKVSPEFLMRLECSNTNHRKMVIGGVALAVLGIAGVYSGYSLYNHFNSDQLMQHQGDLLKTQANQEITQVFGQLNPRFAEPPLDFISKNISKLEINVLSTEEPKTELLNNVNPFVSSCWSKPFYDEAVKINLHNLHEMTEQERQMVIEKFELQSSIDSLGDNFFKKLAEVDKCILELANLVELKFYSKSSGLKYILLTNTEFNKLTLEELKDISSDQKHIIIERIKNNKKEAISDDDLKNNPWQISIFKFSNLNSKQINQFIDQIPANVFSLFSNDQLSGLDLQKISKEQVYHLFSSDPYKRIPLLSSAQLDSIFDKLSDGDIKYRISDDQFKQLNLATLKAHQIQQLLYDNASKRVALLSSAQLDSIFDKLSDGDIKYRISDDQFKQLNLATWKADQIQQLLYGNASKRIALLSSAQLDSIFDKLSDGDIKYRISDDQFKQLNLATLKADQIQQLLYDNASKRVALLSSAQLDSIFDKLSDGDIKYRISDDQFKQLNLATLKADQIQQLLDGNASKRIALLSSAQLDSIFDKLSDGDIKYRISDDQFKQLNLATLKADQIQQLLYDNASKRVALLSSAQLDSIFDKLSDGDIKYRISDDQFKQLNLATWKADQIQQLLDGNASKRIALLSSAQLDSIFDKLSDGDIKYRISDDQFKQLNLATLKADQIQQLLDGNASKRIALLSSAQLDSIFDKLSDGNIKYHISDDQLKLLDMSKLSTKQVGLLFPNCSIEEFRQEYTNNGKLLISEKELIQLCDAIKKKNTHRVSLLSNVQLNHIRGKLSKENQELINS